MDFLLRVQDYIIRHLKLNRFGVKHIDKYVPDIRIDSSKKAKDRLLRIYEPPAFKCTAENEVADFRCNLQIVIPMYNSQKYIFRCINSIINQRTRYIYRIIIIDDGSTDSATPLVRAKYKDYPLEVRRQANRGTAAARNAGITKIEADYVMFVDADDMLAPGAIDSLLDCAYKEDACIVEGGYEFFSNGLRKRVKHTSETYTEPCGKLWGFAWAKVFRASVLKDACFPEGYWYEDTIVSYILYTKCTKAVTLDKNVYLYRRNKNGFSHIRGNGSKLLDSFWVLDNVIKEVQERNIPTTQGMYEFILGSMVTCSRRLMYMNDEIRKEVMEAFSDMLNTTFASYNTENEYLSVFQKVLRNNDYNKYKRVVLCIKE